MMYERAGWNNDSGQWEANIIPNHYVLVAETNEAGGIKHPKGWEVANGPNAADLKSFIRDFHSIWPTLKLAVYPR